MKAFLICGAAMALAACATTGADAPDTPAPGQVSGRCDASRIADLVGQDASSALAADALARSGSRSLRWAHPGTALTMDYRQDRLTIGLDGRNKVTTLNCG
ncbi:MAG: hypothetical protein ABS87_08565 [Sphingomonas sp. SCN 67-18]|mgnify:CR=1 FL=1|uniref:I78 family peptidase inhibitor n=1 Tax=uncultured Sphingomonas sp. TaxID=158754 RepID=UPI00086C6BC7|nr:I78 family peptidase inhibitor [Sphingomonas sp. SCN 67-18]ODU20886.1 MAG: hypothetical protein ABS87_08565 [Sphingomonas sp. SCN 67-18]